MAVMISSRTREREIVTKYWHWNRREKIKYKSHLLKRRTQSFANYQQMPLEFIPRTSLKESKKVCDDIYFSIDKNKNNTT